MGNQSDSRMKKVKIDGEVVEAEAVSLFNDWFNSPFRRG